MWTSRLFWKFFIVCLGLGIAVAIPVAAVCLSGARGAETPPESGSSMMAWFLPPIVIAVGSLAAAVLLSLLVGPPVRQLTASARKATETGKAAPVSLSRWDELGTLTESVNRLQKELSERMTDALQQNQQLARVLDSMVEGVLAIAPGESILLANNSSRRLLDFSVSEPVGRPLLEVTRSRPIYEAFRTTWDTKSPQEVEFESPNASRRNLLLRTTRIPGDPCPGVLVVVHDVSELRRLENLRREFVANVSHELKTPLAAIKAYAETLRMGAVHDPDHNLNFVQRIEEQADRLHQLILDLLQIARVESGQQAFDLRDLDMGGVVRSCVMEFDETAGSRRIDLRLAPADEPLLVHADEEGLRQIIGNLVDNAIKYTPEDGQICVRCRRVDGSACLEVEDNGIGIAPEDQPRIFERFYRIDKARSREMGGTGLGLSIVKHLAQAFGGRVCLTSRQGEGSTFRVELPLRG